MAHGRQQIREALAGMLQDDPALKARGVSFFVARHSPIPLRKLPAVSIYTSADSVAESSWSYAPRKYERTLDVQIEISVKGDEVADQVDAICEEVETVIAADTQLRGTCYRSDLGATALNFNDDGEKKVSQAILSYSVEYETEATAPLGEADELQTITASYRLSAEQDENELAKDSIDVS